MYHKERSDPLYRLGDLQPVPEELIERLKSVSGPWYISQGIIYNYKCIDSRAGEWKHVLDELCQSSLASTVVFVEFYVELSSSNWSPCLFMKHTGNDAFTHIENSPLCVQSIREKSHLAARMAPLCKALPFVTQLFQNPPDENDEARHPKGCYVKTMSVMLKGLHVRVHLHRL